MLTQSAASPLRLATLDTSPNRGQCVDTIGNPLTYNNGSTYTMSWTGRQLDSVTTGGVTTTYDYDSSGMRTTKTVGNKTYEYLYYGGQLVRYSADSYGYLYFHYDDNGTPLGFTFDNSSYQDTYYYVLNLQGDVVQLRNEQGGIVANYNYDAWGKLLSVTNASGNVITSSSSMAIINPLRYRGYVYDAETGFYYLQSRYYDPALCRFISADGLISTGTGVIGYNMFAYCNNNPVMCVDSCGTRPISSTSVANESKEDRKTSCAFISAISRNQLTFSTGAAGEFISDDSTGRNCYAYVLGEESGKTGDGSVS